jgi:hypothetical protein
MKTRETYTPPLFPSEHNKRDCYLNRDVYLFKHENVINILDFHRGQFYGLDEIASRMIDLILEKSFEETVTEISDLYEVSAAQIRGDLTELLNSLIQKKVLITSPPPEKSTDENLFQTISLGVLHRITTVLRKIFNPQTDPNAYTVELLLTLSWISLRVLGWSRTLDLWQKWHKSHSKNIGKETIKNLDRVVRETASGKLFLPMVCKERALVAYHLLRSFYDFPATLVIGINNYPFQIHAWVECGGLILTDEPAHCEQFTPVISYS